MPVSVIRAKGQVTIPQDVREAAHLKEGDPVEIEITADGILLRPQKLIDASQAWFWTQEWQQGEREASDDIKTGRVTTLESAAAFPDPSTTDRQACRPSPKPIGFGATSRRSRRSSRPHFGLLPRSSWPTFRPGGSG